MKQLELTREDTKMVKGMAIILMLIHHLFAFPDRIHFDYIYIAFISGNGIELIIGRFGKICVGMFLFLSGFGIYKQYYNNEKNIISIILKKLKGLYINYWLVFIIFIPIRFFFLNKQFILSEFIDNIVGYSSSYNKEWWFFAVYILLIITFPLSVKIINNNSVYEILKIIVIAVVIRTIIPVLVKNPIMIDFSKTVFYKELYLMLQWLPCFLMGIAFAKIGLFSKLKKFFIDNKLDNIVVHMIIFIGIIYIRYRNNNDRAFDYLLVPMFIFSIINIIKTCRLNKIFSYLGKHSTNMWLVHSFFCYYYFQQLVFYPKISVIIILWLIILSVISSIFINFIKECIKKVVALRKIKDI